MESVKNELVAWLDSQSTLIASGIIISIILLATKIDQNYDVYIAVLIFIILLALDRSTTYVKSWSMATYLLSYFSFILALIGILVNLINGFHLLVTQESLGFTPIGRLVITALYILLETVILRWARFRFD